MTEPLVNALGTLAGVIAVMLTRELHRLLQSRLTAKQYDFLTALAQHAVIAAEHVGEKRKLTGPEKYELASSALCDGARRAGIRKLGPNELQALIEPHVALFTGEAAQAVGQEDE